MLLKAVVNHCFVETPRPCLIAIAFSMVMARKDVGPYSPSNVWCALVEDNHNEYNLNKGSQAGKAHRKRLSPDVVKAIYESNDQYSMIAAQHGLDVHSVHRIKCRKCYKQITERLVKGSWR